MFVGQRHFLCEACNDHDPTRWRGRSRNALPGLRFGFLVVETWRYLIPVEPNALASAH